MLTLLYIPILLLCCITALSRWRTGVVAAVIIDVIRDPVRKLDPSQPVWITLSLLAVWACVFAGAYAENSSILRSTFAALPSLRRAIQYAFLALLPGAIVSLTMYVGGYKLVVLGLASYMAPFAGIILGMHYLREPNQLYRLLSVYVVVNSIAMVSVLAELNGWPLPGLGGLSGVTWLRSSGSSQFLLVSGFYRGPDIMGLHAAHIVIFSIALAANRLSRSRTPWFGSAIWGIVCLIVGGRRKMFIMPITFLLSNLVFNRARGVSIIQKSFVPAVLLLLGAGFFLAFISEEYVSSEYQKYAMSVFDEGLDRAQTSMLGGSIQVLNEYGILGKGIGTSTQGGRYFGVNQDWQEDGVSRLFAELGLVGVLFLIASAYNLFIALRTSQNRAKNSFNVSNLQALLFSVGIADLSSYVISHQHYSGDPGSAVFALLLVGMAVGAPYLLLDSDARTMPATASTQQPARF